MRRVALALMLAACHAPGHGSSARPLEVLVPSDAETLDPRYVTDTVGFRASRLIHAGLTKIDPDTLLAVPDVALSLTWEDALTLHVKLRPGLHFHSGAPLDASDVVATFHAIASPEVHSRHAGMLEPIAEVTAEGPLDVRFVLKRPHATLLTDLELPILRRDEATSPPDTHGALDGLGPYEVARWERGDLELTPVSQGASHALHALSIRTVHDENARALRLLSGDADVCVNGISPTLLPALDGREGLHVASSPGANLTYLVVRVDRGVLADRRAREAISLALDRTGLAKTLFAGHARPADSVLPSGHWAETPGPPYAFDPEEARRLAHESGLDQAHLSLLAGTERFRLTLARTVAQELGDVGIPVTVTPLELGTLIGRLNAGDFDVAQLQLPEIVEPNLLRVFLHSSEIPPAGANRGRVQDGVIDELLDQGDKAREPEARKEVYARLEERLRSELFIVPLWHEDQVAVVSPRAASFHPSPDGRWGPLAAIP